MDFWARQAEARQRSGWLIVVFAAAVISIVVAVNVVVLAVLAAFDAGQPAFVQASWVARYPEAVVATTLGVLAVVSLASLYKTSALAGGGGVVARSLGGLRVQADTHDPLQRRLLDVVEEMAIASGVPVPAVYVLGQEEGINAFAAGHTPANAAITVTAGALRYLDRAELQGVIGHEFSHIVNGDMRLNIRLMGLLYGLLVIAIVGRTMAWYMPRGGRRGQGVGLFIMAAFAVMALGYIGVFFGRLIQAAVSRQRERLADASSVQFNRDSTGLRNALVKIGSVQGSRIHHPHVDEVAHMLFAPGMTRLFATHPPLLERIRALDPSFDPAEFKNLRLEVKPQPLGVVKVVTDEPLPRSFLEPQTMPQRPAVRLDPGAVRGLVGNPGSAHVLHAQAMRQSLRDGWLAGGDPAVRAAALLLALVIDGKPAVRAAQLKRVSAALGGDLEGAVEEQVLRVQRLQPEQKLPLLGGIVPVLRQLPPPARERILQCLTALCRADGEIAIFEYALATLARTYLEEGLAPHVRARRVRLADATAEVQALFSALASHGHNGGAAAESAYRDGIGRLGLAHPPPFRPVPGWAAALDHALRCLDGLEAAEKSRLVEGLAAAATHDGQVTVSEGELLRAICAVLHCPLPPLVDRG